MTGRLIYAHDARGLGLRGLLPYRSTFAARAKGETRDALASQRVYRFKTLGESAEVWRQLIEAAREDLGCVTVWTVPPHDPNTTSALQNLFGVTIRRARTAQPRKYNHAAPVEIGSMDYPEPPAGRVLLVDDVATTGATLCAIRDHLRERYGIEAVPLALGINARLLPKNCDTAALMAQWERFAEAVRGPAGMEKSETRYLARMSGRSIERRDPADPKRRADLEADPAAWLRYYLAQTFPLPFGHVHERMITAAVWAIRTGAGMCVAAPRGTGKSSVLWGVALWAILSGACRFPTVAAWAHTAARRMLRRWLEALAANERIRADYPETCAPFENTIHPVRLRMLRWKDTREPCGADVRIGDGVLVLPDGRGAIAAASIWGNTRGLFAAMPNGETLRPDVLLLDDPQDAETANSAPLVRKTVERVKGDLLSLSGPDVRLSVMAAVTVIAADDVSEHLLRDPDFEAIRCGQIETWPDGFHDRTSETRRLWEAWNVARVEGLADHDGGERARRFYEQHKAAMTRGMAVSWAERYDRKRGDPDALFAAMWDFYRLGEAAFMAERQNEPLRDNPTVYTLTPELVASRIHAGRRFGEVPPQARLIIAATDLNFYGLHWAVVAFANDGTAWVIAYGRHDGPRGGDVVPRDTPEPVAKRMLFEALVRHGRELGALQLVRAGQRVRPSVWLVDAGFMADTVRRFVEVSARVSGIPTAAARGFSADKYRPNASSTIGQPREQCHAAESPITGRFIAFNADYWRETMQRAWLAEPNAPGSLSLYEGRHAELAEHVTRERLVEKLAGALGTFWRWHTMPGRHDWADALTMCFVGAAYYGIGTAASLPRRRVVRYRETRKARYTGD